MRKNTQIFKHYSVLIALSLLIATILTAIYLLLTLVFATEFFFTSDLTYCYLCFTLGFTLTFIGFLTRKRSPSIHREIILDEDIS